jgi:hypothetical protein
MKNTTINELGDTLPIGKVAPDGTRLRDFAFKGWRTSEEKAIGKYREENPGLSHGQFVTYVLAYFLTHWCGESFEGVPIPKRMLSLSTGYAADVLYAWIALRRQALSDELKMDLHCGKCRQVIPYAISLGTVDVKEVEDDEPLTVPFQLRDGLTYREQDNRILTLAPLHWFVHEGATTGGVNLGDLKTKVVCGSIVGLDQVDGDVRLPEEALDLTKYDLEQLVAYVNDWQPGPDLSIDVTCTKCSSRLVHSIPWMIDDFFSLRASSTSGQSKT